MAKGYGDARGVWANVVSRVWRLGFVRARARLADESRSELDAHYELLVDRYVRAGMTVEDARAAARRQLGNVTLVAEEIHRMNSIRWIEAAGQDTRYALRQFRRSPGFSAVVVITLALGIGGTTAVFSVVQAVLLAPLPYQEPGRLVRIYQQEPDKPATRRSGVSGPHFTTLRDHAASFTDVTALNTRTDVGLDLFRDRQAQRLRVLQVASDYFRTLRAEPSGPGFGLEDERGTRRIVLSDAVWRSRFNGDPSVIGTTIHLSAEPYEVAGVAPANLEDPIVGAVDAWIPYNLASDTFEQNYSLTIVGRLRTGITVSQAGAELAIISQSLKERFPDVRASSIVMVPLREDLVGTSRGVLQLLLIAVGLVLLVACVNVANLVLVRATGRVHEFAVRAALGSGVGRLARQLLVESLVLAGLGGLAGLAIAELGVALLKTFGRDAIPRIGEVGLDATVLGFAALVTVSTALAFGVAPALRLARTHPNRTLNQHSRSTTGGRREGRLRSSLAAAQLALALTLLVGAGVLLASFHRLRQVPLGFQVDRVLTFGVNLPGVRYDATRRADFHEELSRRIERLPGVVAAGGTSRLPAIGSYQTWPVAIETGPLAGTSVKQPEQPEQRTVSGRFFTALGIPVLAGRVFDDRDDGSAPGRAVVSAGFARLAFPGLPLDQVVGQRFTVFGRYKREIIGVVGDVTLDVYGRPAASIYSSHRQFAGNRNWALTQVVATDLPPDGVLGAISREVAGLDPELVVYQAAPMTEIVGRGASRERFALVLMGTFAAVSLTLAAIGLYGVLSYTVRQRTKEIAIRIALGATSSQVRALVLRQAALVLVAGLVAGLSGALILGRWLSSIVFEIHPSDPRILLATASLLVLTGLVSAWLPARRASRMEPRFVIQEG